MIFRPCRYFGHHKTGGAIIIPIPYSDPRNRICMPSTVKHRPQDPRSIPCRGSLDQSVCLQELGRVPCQPPVPFREARYHHFSPVPQGLPPGPLPTTLYGTALIDTADFSTAVPSWPSTSSWLPPSRSQAGSEPGPPTCSGGDSPAKPLLPSAARLRVLDSGCPGQ